MSDQMINLVDMTLDQIVKTCVEVNDEDQARGLRALLILADEELVPMPEKPARVLVEHGYLIQEGGGIAWTNDAKEIVARVMDDWKFNSVTRVDKLLTEYRKREQDRAGERLTKADNPVRF
jgi:hypothetical protein